MEDEREREGAVAAGCWWRIERDQDDGIGVAGVEWRQGEIGWDGGWVGGWVSGESVG